MDLIGENPLLNVQDRNFKIFSRNTARPPQYHDAKSVVKNSLISEGCRIFGEVENCVLSGGVTVQAGAIIKNSVVMNDVTVCAGAEIYTAIIDSEVNIGKNAKIGKENAGKDNITVIAHKTSVADNAVIGN